jgi:hypothetical protein
VPVHMPMCERSWPSTSHHRPHMPERCAGDLFRGYMTTVDSKSVGRFDKKLAVQRLFPSLSSWGSPSCLQGPAWGFGFCHTGLWARPRLGALGGALVMPRKIWSLVRACASSSSPEISRTGHWPLALALAMGCHGIWNPESRLVPTKFLIWPNNHNLLLQPGQQRRINPHTAQPRR